MKVRELLRSKPAALVTVTEEVDIAAAARLMMERGIGGLPVLRGAESVVGFLSERDLVNAVHQHPEGLQGLPVKAVMHRPPPLCSGEDSLRSVMARMTHERLRHLVVMEEGRIAGVVSVGDLLKERLELLETETGVLRDYVAGQRARR